MTNINVIFLGAGPTALAGIREVGEAGIQTYAIGLNPYETALFSKYTKKLGYANPEKEPEKLLQILDSFKYTKDTINILIPTGDESIEFLSKNKDKLKNKFIFSLLKNDISELILNKEKFADLCEKVEIPAPKTWTSNSKISLEEWAETVMYPCFVVFTANFKEDYVEQIFTGRKIRQYPVNFGTTTCAISENIEEIKEYSIRLLKHINYNGVCDVEFKYDNRDNLYKIIEVNARTSGKKPLLASIYTMANINKSLEEISEKEGVVWLFPIRDIPAILKLNNKLQNFKIYFKKNKVWCIFDKKDPFPFFMYFFEMIYKLYKYKIGK